MSLRLLWAFFSYINMQRKKHHSPGSQSECQGKTSNPQTLLAAGGGDFPRKQGPCMPVLLRGRVLWLGSPQAFFLPPSSTRLCDRARQHLARWPPGSQLTHIPGQSPFRHHVQPGLLVLEVQREEGSRGEQGPNSEKKWPLRYTGAVCKGRGDTHEEDSQLGLGVYSLTAV